MYPSFKFSLFAGHTRLSTTFCQSAAVCPPRKILRNQNCFKRLQTKSGSFGRTLKEIRVAQFFPESALGGKQGPSVPVPHCTRFLLEGSEGHLFPLNRLQVAQEHLNVKGISDSGCFLIRPGGAEQRNSEDLKVN